MLLNKSFLEKAFICSGFQAERLRQSTSFKDCRSGNQQTRKMELLGERRQIYEKRKEKTKRGRGSTCI